jgi:hypothetical protein
MPRVPLAEWQAEQVRVTVFATTEVVITWQQWWAEAVQSEPDDVTVNPKKHSGTIQGEYGPGRLVLGTQPGRIDWVLLPTEAAVEESITTGELPSVGAVVDAVESFSKIMEQWLSRDDLPVVGRIAFGAVLNHPEANRAAAYERVPDYVPVQLPPGSTDFSFQINRPQPSATGIEGLAINRLSKWNVAALLKIATEGVFPAPPGIVSLRVELDINTVPTFKGLFPRERLIEIYRELLSEGMRIAADGVPTL